MRKLHRAMEQFDSSSSSSEMQNFLKLVRGESIKADAESDEEDAVQAYKSELAVLPRIFTEEGGSTREVHGGAGEAHDAEDGKHVRLGSQGATSTMRVCMCASALRTPAIQWRFRA